MCGIFGIVSNASIIDKLLEGLKSLEYRGYDSSGISTLSSGKISTVKSIGKIAQLKSKIQSLPENHLAECKIGMAHNRWATHGKPSEINAHPHALGKISIVHNGIIANSSSLKQTLISEGHKFTSDTDTEVALHLINKHLLVGLAPVDAMKKTASMLKGSFAILAMFSEYPDSLFAIKYHSPMVVGYGKNENYVSSDSISISKYTDRIAYLEDGDIAIIDQNNISIIDINNQPVTRDIHTIKVKHSDATKGNFDYYMHKEIFEQPTTTKNAIAHYLGSSTNTLSTQLNSLNMKNVERVYIIACGSSYFAGMVAQHWLESIAKIPTSIRVASEFAADPFVSKGDNLGIFISQSGETADTMAALKEFNKTSQKTIGIVNSDMSNISRNVDFCLPIHAGNEIGVASTKAFTNQLVVLLCISLEAALQNKSISQDEYQKHVSNIHEIPGRISELLSHESDYQEISKKIHNHNSIIYIGRGSFYALALEGSLKLKELSYIHAEAMPSGELKHGSIALIDENISVIAMLPEDHLFDKNLLSIESILSRQGKVIAITGDKGYKMLHKKCDIIHVNQSAKLISSIVHIIPLQLIAYHTALLKGNNVDQPRNLAKSVTVE